MCDGRGMGSTAGVKGSAQGSWDVRGRQDGEGLVPLGLQRGWAVPPPLAVRGWSFQPCLGHHVRMKHAHLEVERTHVALPVYLSLQILFN